MATEKRLIDANEYKMALEKIMADACATHDWGYEAILDDCIWELDAQTTVDAVEVVRCKDCKYGDMCSIREAMAVSDWNAYCYRGERKDND